PSASEIYTLSLHDALPIFTMLTRFHRIHGLDHLTDMWEAWEVWFAELEESHTSLPAVVFFRSPQPEHSWITAAGAVLDAAALAQDRKSTRLTPVTRSSRMP